MKIVVCIKQVPDVDDIKWTKENNLDRALMLSKINPYDEKALDYALKIKEKSNEPIDITVISMGPINAKEILEYSLAKGATRAILLSDKLFGGADTLITSDILSRAIKKYIPDFDIIITGQAAVDGDTQQVPVNLATKLDVVDVIHCIDISLSQKSIIATQKLDNELNSFEVILPCLCALDLEKVEKHSPKIEDYVRSQNTSIEIYTAQDLGVEKSAVITSPTVVYKAFRPNQERNPKTLGENFSKELLNLILKVNENE